MIYYESAGQPRDLIVPLQAAKERVADAYPFGTHTWRPEPAWPRLLWRRSCLVGTTQDRHLIRHRRRDRGDQDTFAYETQVLRRVSFLAPSGPALRMIATGQNA